MHRVLEEKQSKIRDFVDNSLHLSKFREWLIHHNYMAYLVVIYTCILISFTVFGHGGVNASIDYTADGVLGQNDFNGSYQNGVAPDNFGLNGPENLAVDSISHLLFVADSQNNRVLVYQLDPTDNLISHNAFYVLGQSNFTSQTCQYNQSSLCDPEDVLYDPTTQLLFVADSSNGRVMIYDLSNGISNGMNASYVLGTNTFTQAGCNSGLNKLCQPSSLAYDSADKELFVSDMLNRVVVFNLSSGITDGMNPSYVIGQSSFSASTTYCASGSGSTQSGFCEATKITYDPDDKYLFVDDSTNDRVMVFDLSSGISNDMNASFVLGQINFTTVTTTNCNGTTSNSGLCHVIFGLTYDSTNKLLFVSDTANSRVLVFNLSSGITNDMAASNVLGQPDFSIATCYNTLNPTASDLCEPGGMLYDPISKDLFVTDQNSNRILEYDLSGGVTNGMSAAYVLGQSDFTTSFADATAAPNNFGFDVPQDVVLDSTNHHLFVADKFNNRVLVYDLDANNNLTGTTANYVLGQSDFSGSGCSPSQSQFCAPLALAYDSVHNYLFVASEDDHVFVYNLSGGISDGMNASYVLGQSNYTNHTCGTTQSVICQPWGLAFDASKDWLFVSDQSNARVLIFDLSGGISDGMNASYVLGQTSFTGSSCSIGSSGLCNTYGLTFDAANNRLFVSNFGSLDVQVFNLSGTVTNGMNASFTITGLQTTGLAYDDVNSRLFAGSNYQVDILSVPGSTSSNITAAGASLGTIGQAQGCPFGSGATSQTDLCTVTGLAYDSVNDRLYAVDTDNNRVMQFDLAMSISTSSLPAGEVGVTYSQSLQTVNADSPVTYAITTGSLPGGLSLDNSTGNISGQPNQDGSFNFTVQATGSNSATASAQLGINVNTGPKITVSSLPDGTVNTAYDQTVPVTGGEPPYSISIVNGEIPDGLSLNGSSGEITGTPISVGDSYFTLQVEDSNGITSTQDLAINIQSAPEQSRSRITGSSSSVSSTPAATTTTPSQNTTKVTNATPIDLDASPQFEDSSNDTTAASISSVVPNTEFTFTLPTSTGTGSDTSGSTTSDTSSTSSSTSTTTHTVIVNNIDPTAGTANITIHSNPINVTLHLNDPQEIDVGDTGSNNFGIELVSIDKSVSPASANVKFWRISTTTVSENTAGINHKSTAVTSSLIKSKSKSTVYIIMGGIFVGVVTVLIIWLLRRHDNKNKLVQPIIDQPVEHK